MGISTFNLQSMSEWNVKTYYNKEIDNANWNEILG